MTDTNRHFDDGDNSETSLDAAVWSVLAEPIDREAVERVTARAAGLAATSHPNVRASRAARFDRRRIFALSSLAAAILLVVGAALLTIPARSSFAMVMEQLKAAGAFRYTTLIYTDQQPQRIETRVMVAEDGRQRSEIAGTVSILDSSGRPRLTLIETMKAALVREAEKPAPDMGRHQLRWLEELRSHHGDADRKLEPKTIDGRKVEGFEVDRDGHAFTIWVDAKTHELVEIEHGAMVEGSPIRKVVMKDFEFNQSFDESLFSFEVPAGYRARELAPAPELVPGEQSIVEALRGYTEVADGKFPKSLADWGEWAVLFSRSDLPAQETTKIMSRLGAITPFLFGMSEEDYEYLGAGKATSDARTIVFWYRTQEGPVRAIYNDFSVAEIDKKELPEGE